MEANSILEELCRVKDDLAREAWYDTHRFLENLRKWAAEHFHTGPVVRNTEELRQLSAKKERQHAGESALALNAKPPPKP